MKRVGRYIPLIFLILISCSTPNYKLYTNDNVQHDCVDAHEVKGGWDCDGVFYPDQNVAYVVTSLKSA